MASGGGKGGLNAGAAAWTPGGGGGGGSAASSPSFAPPASGGGGGGGSFRGGGGGGGNFRDPNYGGGPGNYGGGHGGGHGGGAPFHGHSSHGSAQHSPPPPGAGFHGGGGGGGNFHGGHGGGGGRGHHHGGNMGPGHQGFGPQTPNSHSFGPHQNAWQQASNRHGPPANMGPRGGGGQEPLRTPVGIVMGTPRAGKTSVGAMLAQQLKWGHIDPHDMDPEGDRYEHLDKCLAQMANTQPRGVLISGYGADSDADIFYLLHAVQNSTHRLKVIYVGYMDMPYDQIQKRKEDGEVPTTTEMSMHCIGYEACSKYLSDAAGFQLVSVMEDAIARDVKSIAEEMFAKIMSLVNDMRSPVDPVPMPKPEAFERWSLVTDYQKYRTVVKALDEALGSNAANSVFPLRVSGAGIDYNRFVRHHHQLQQFDVSLATNGSRVVVFKVGHDVYALQEHCASVYVLDDSKLEPFASLHPGSQTEVVFALEAEFCAVKAGTDAEAHANHVLIRDLVYFEGKVMQRTPRHLRKQIIEARFKESVTQYVLVHVSFSINRIEELVNVGYSIESIVTGIRFEHPYAYRVRANNEDYDNRLFAWTDGDKPMQTLRLWNSTTVSSNNEMMYRFELMVVDDDTGIEKVLAEEHLPIPGKKPKSSPPQKPATVDITFAAAEEQDINDGQLVECRFIRHAAPVIKSGPAARSGAKGDFYLTGTWNFVRRRREVLFPAYETTVVEATREKGWPRDQMVAACSEMVHRDPAAANRPPGSPAHA